MESDEGYSEEGEQPVRPSGGKEQRRIPRTETEGSVLWSYASNPVFPENEGVLIDSNQLGIGFYSKVPIKEGSVVRIKAKGLWKDYRYATIMRCNKVDDEMCINGLVFNLSLYFI